MACHGPGLVGQRQVKAVRRVIGPACNLRVCTNAENRRNMRVCRGESQYKGVSVARGNTTRVWAAYIWFENKKIELGNYETEEEAARAYNAAALKYHGDFACLNEIPGLTKEESCRPPERNRTLGRRRTKSKYKGVSKHGKKWRVSIAIDGRHLLIGSHKTEEQAALAYNLAALEFGKTNLNEVVT